MQTSNRKRSIRTWLELSNSAFPTLVYVRKLQSHILNQALRSNSSVRKRLIESQILIERFPTLRKLQHHIMNQALHKHVHCTINISISTKYCMCIHTLEVYKC